MSKQINIKEPQRLSVFTIIIALVQVVKSLWPILLILGFQLMSGGNGSMKDVLKSMGYLFGIILVIILTKINNIFQYFTTTFFINDKDEFIFKTGLFTKKQIIIPLEKIQSIQSKQNILNRITNTFTVTIETAGSSNAEANLLAISIEQLNSLRIYIQVEKERNAPVNIVENSIESSLTASKIKLSILDFLRLCISENHIKTFGIVAAFLFGKYNEFKELFKFDEANWISNTIEKNETSFSAILILTVIILIITIIISSIFLALKYFGFVINLDTKKMYIQWGLLSTQQKTIYYNKIQMLDWRSNLIRRLLKLAILRVYATGENEHKREGQINLPITNSSQIDTILSHYQSNTLFDTTNFLRVHKSYILRYTILIGIPVFTVVATFFAFKEPWLILIPTIWLMYFVIAKTIYQKRFKLWVNNDCLKIEQGVWGVENILLNWNNIQSVALATSPYQRSHDLRDLILYTAGKPVRIHYLPLQQAQLLHDYALYKIEKP